MLPYAQLHNAKQVLDWALFTVFPPEGLCFIALPSINWLSVWAETALNTSTELKSTVFVRIANYGESVSNRNGDIKTDIAPCGKVALRTLSFSDGQRHYSLFLSVFSVGAVMWVDVRQRTLLAQ